MFVGQEPTFEWNSFQLLHLDRLDLALLANIGLECQGILGTNTLAYQEHFQITAIGFYDSGPRFQYY